MDIKLRYCNKCSRRTIQCKDIFFNHIFSPAQAIKVWYCPNCGTQWNVIKESKDIDVNEVS